jgi:hypothetical protein
MKESKLWFREAKNPWVGSPIPVNMPAKYEGLVFWSKIYVKILTSKIRESIDLSIHIGQL